MKTAARLVAHATRRPPLRLATMGSTPTDARLVRFAGPRRVAIADLKDSVTANAGILGARGPGTISDGSRNGRLVRIDGAASCSNNAKHGVTLRPVYDLVSTLATS